MTSLDTIRMGASWARSLAKYHVGGKPRPFSASLSVTSACNLHCSYCDFPTLGEKPIAVEDAATIIKKLHKLGVRRLGMLGGEPMVHREIDTIIDVAKQTGMYVCVNTNLNLYAKVGAKIQRADMVFTSIDGRKESHIKNRGKTSWDGIFEAISDWRNKGKPLVAITVLTEHNLDDVEWLIAQAEEYGYQQHFQPQCLDTVIARGAGPNTALNGRMKAVWQDIRAAKASGKPIASSRAYLDQIVAWSDYGESSRMDESKKCAAGRGYLFVDPNGDAYPCPYLKGAVAPINLLQDDWSSWDERTPCTDCIVGPMLEFNLLYRNPQRALMDIAGAYG